MGRGTLVFLLALGAAGPAAAEAPGPSPGAEADHAEEDDERDRGERAPIRRGAGALEDRADEEDGACVGIAPWVWVLGCGGALLAVGVVGFVVAAALGVVYVIALVVIGANLFEQIVCAPLCSALCGALSFPGLCAMTCNGVLGDLFGGCNAFTGACSGVGDSCSGCSGPSCSGPSFIAAPGLVAPSAGLSSAAWTPALSAAPAGAMLY